MSLLQVIKQLFINNGKIGHPVQVVLLRMFEKYAILQHFIIICHYLIMNLHSRGHYAMFIRRTQISFLV